MRKRTLIWGGVIIVLFIIIAGAMSDSGTPKGSSNQPVTTVSGRAHPDNVAGFNMKGSTAGTYQYTKDYAGKSYAVAMTENGSMDLHNESYPVDRETIQVVGIDVNIGYRDESSVNGTKIMEKYEPISFDFKDADKTYSGEISNLSMASDKDNLRTVLETFIQGLTS